jgi:hypothetical protein
MNRLQQWSDAILAEAAMLEPGKTMDALQEIARQMWVAAGDPSNVEMRAVPESGGEFGLWDKRQNSFIITFPTAEDAWNWVAAQGVPMIDADLGQYESQEEYEAARPPSAADRILEVGRMAQEAYTTEGGEQA